MPKLENLTYEEEEAIEELEMRMKNSLTPVMHEEGKLLYYRFLKARDFDVNKAEKMLRKHLIWRKIWQIDTILEDFKPRELFLKYSCPNMVGIDKKGDIVIYMAVGTLNPDEVAKYVMPNNNMKHWFWSFEEIIKSVKENNKERENIVYQGIFVLDLDKIPFSSVASRLSVDLVKRFLIALQDNYPERCKYAFFINAPSYYEVFFSIIKTVMSGAVINKVHMFGRNTRIWKEKLLESVDADVLPAFLGGNRTDPDGNPMCNTLVNHSCRIPERYFLSQKEMDFTDASQIKEILLSPMKKEEMHVDVNELGSLLKWEFFVKGNDVGFGVFLEISEHKMTEIIPIHKIGTPHGVEKDSLRCRSTGRYIFVFDNSHSWISWKEIQYCISVVNPKL